MSKSYSQILEEKDIDEALKYLEPRQTTYKSTTMIRMIINELKEKGIIKDDWWNKYIKEYLGEKKD